MSTCPYIESDCTNWDTIENHCDFTPDHKYCQDRECNTLKPGFKCIYMGPEDSTSEVRCFFIGNACKEIIDYCTTNKCINIDTYLGKNYCKYVRNPTINCQLVNKTLSERPSR